MYKGVKSSILQCRPLTSKRLQYLAIALREGMLFYDRSDERSSLLGTRCDRAIERFRVTVFHNLGHDNLIVSHICRNDNSPDDARRVLADRINVQARLILYLRDVKHSSAHSDDDEHSVISNLSARAYSITQVIQPFLLTSWLDILSLPATKSKHYRKRVSLNRRSIFSKETLGFKCERLVVVL